MRAMPAPPPNRRCWCAERPGAARTSAVRRAVRIAAALAVLSAASAVPNAAPAAISPAAPPADSAHAAPPAARASGARADSVHAALPPAARPTTLKVVQRSDDEVMLLGVRLDQDELDALLQTYPTAAGTLVPLGEFCAALEIGAEVDAPAGRAVVHGRQTLQLDAATGHARVGVRDLAAGPGEVEVHSDDIYVAVARLAAWLDLELTVDQASACVVVRSAWRLPIQDRVERRRQELLLSGTGGAGAPDYSRFHPPRPLMSLPFVDLTLRTTRMDRPGVERWDYNTFAAGGLLYMDADVLLQGNETNPLALATGGLGRRDPDPVLLGPLHAREFRIGEVYTDGLALVTLPMAGPGGAVGNLPLERPAQFDVHVFRGRMP